jgi:hypothetical protein
LQEFPLVVIPDSHRLTPDFRQAVTSYVEQGGSLLLLGERCARLFEPILGVELEGEPAQRDAELASFSDGLVRGRVTNASGLWQKVKRTTATPWGALLQTRNIKGPWEIAAAINKAGRGQVGAVYGPVASIYFRSHHPWLRDFIGDLADKLFPKPAVEVISGPSGLEVSLRRTRDGKLAVHLLNTANRPLPDRFGFTDHIPSLENIHLIIQTPSKPHSVTWVPDGGKLVWLWQNGHDLAVTVPKLRIHGVVILD